jgi:hypothetical protein
MFLLGSLATSAFATPLVFTRSTAGVQLNTGFSLCADDTGNVANTTTTASCTSANGEAGAIATFGRIGAAASGTSDVPFTNAAGTATFRDVLTVGGVNPAASIYVGIIVSLAGDTQFNGEGNLTAGLIDMVTLSQATAGADIKTVSPFRPRAGTFSEGSSQYFQSGLCDNLCEMTLFLPFVGNAEVLNMSLSAQAIGENAAALFMDTAKVVSVGVYDGINGNLVPGATFTWGSGATYPLAGAAAPPAAVPEPATMLLVGSGLVVGFVRRRR